MNKKTVIIVGGGTAGLTIASQLHQHFKVIVLEKSKSYGYPLIYKIPLMIGLLFRNKTQPYIASRELALDWGRTIPFFESRVLGGASLINGCVHTIGAKVLWERMLQKFNSNYSELLDSYPSLYSLDSLTVNKIHLVRAPQNKVDQAFVETIGHKGIPIGDTNFSNNENCGPIYNTTKKIFRSSVLSLLRIKDLDLRLGQKVNQLIISPDSQVLGVTTESGNIAADHVILAGGVIGTCDLLMREKKRAISVTHTNMANINVGNGLQDHVNLRVNVIANQNTGSLNEISCSFIQKIALLFKHCFGIPTLMVGTGATSAVHLDLNSDGLVDTRIQIVQFTETGRHGSDGKYFDSEAGFSLSITPINPESKGNISLGPDGLLIKPCYLSNPRDIEILKAALSYCLMLLCSEPLSNFVKTILNQEQIENDPEAYIRNNIYSGHHLIGGAQDAVDQNFMVKGIGGLSICDASIFDGYAASNIHSSVVLIANIFSKRFLTL
jgi:choline dehydrogenase-like flavoprotein